ncbi:hypothetical protein NEHOM01_0465 [Nematocida homosporus]|uniref:uncharacterized protein n=1 Tax=Nematocida homosporus TaxID=1912981 RepID=UPI00221F617A|nr:uncharacterized protein NEHOM01_0465 [Nematocida homosporus]KAI5184914.1 hypothetical protein NEHOM01_0465 [Nematocida homosporus]
MERLDCTNLDYSVQYAEMYKDRTLRLGRELEKYLGGLGYTKSTTPMEQETLLIGCISITTARASVAKIIHQIDKVGEVVDPAITEEKEYFIESAEIERIKLELPADEEKSLISGAVVGLIGQKVGMSFKVTQVIYPITAYTGPQPPVSVGDSESPPCKRMDFGEQEVVVLPRVNGLGGKKSLLNLFQTRGKVPEKVFLLEGLVADGGKIDGVDKTGKIDVIDKKLSSFGLRELIAGMEKQVCLIPGAEDYVPLMVPYTPPSRELLHIGEECQILTNPAVVTVFGQRVVFCPLAIVKEIMWYFGSEGSEDINEYFRAMECIIRCRHISPTSPDRCPTYPLKTDPFVLDTVPDVLVLCVDKLGPEIRDFAFENGSVALVVLSSPDKGVLFMREEGLALEIL